MCWIRAEGGNGERQFWDDFFFLFFFLNLVLGSSFPESRSIGSYLFGFNYFYLFVVDIDENFPAVLSPLIELLSKSFRPILSPKFVSSFLISF